MKKKRFSEEQMVSILREADTGDKTIVELCRAHGISDVTFYAWRRKFGQMSEAAVRRLRELEKDNVRLKRLLAERDLEADVLKELLQKKWPPSRNAAMRSVFWFSGKYPGVEPVI